MASASDIIETPTRIEPARLEETPEATADAIVALSSASAGPGHPAASRDRREPLRSRAPDELLLQQPHRGPQHAAPGYRARIFRRRAIPWNRSWRISSFERRYRFEGTGPAARILAMAAAHHRLNYIHPFPDGNGRVSRLMSHAMALKAGIGAHGLWSVSRGLARGHDSGREYKEWMDRADTPRQGDLDGRGNLSRRALVDFTLWFLKVCLDQVTFMGELFDLDNLDARVARHVERSDRLKPEAARLLREALVRGRIDRGEASRIRGCPSARPGACSATLSTQGCSRRQRRKAPSRCGFRSIRWRGSFRGSIRIHEQSARNGPRLPHVLAIAPDVSFGADTLSSPLRGLAP